MLFTKYFGGKIKIYWNKGIDQISFSYRILLLPQDKMVSNHSPKISVWNVANTYFWLVNGK